MCAGNSEYTMGLKEILSQAIFKFQGTFIGNFHERFVKRGI